ncbi:MAG: hypothetical protein ABSC19_08845 [Syntrophorhabdales bacterium]|jgi:hypothetical protein
MPREIVRFLGRIRWLAVALGLAGLMLVIISDDYVKPLSSLWGLVVSHVGIALLIAGIIGLILELTEMKAFFEERLMQLLTSENFLGLLDDGTLRRYTLKAMEQIILRKAKNTRYYDHTSLPSYINGEILPALGGVYCEDYNEATEFNVLQPDDVQALNLEPAVPVSKTINRVTYDLIAPNENVDAEVTIRYYNDARELSSLPAGRQFELRLFLWEDGKDDEWEPKVNVEEFVKSENGLRILEFTHKTTFKNLLRCRIESTTYESPLPSYTIRYMKYPSRNITVHFASNLAVKPDGEIYGITPDYTPPFKTDHALTLRYPGWILESQGYFIVWRIPTKKEP